MSSIAAIILAVLVIGVSWLTFSPASPKVVVKERRGEQFTFPGPTLSSCFSALRLDGLTIIPLVHLPPIKLSFAVPLLSHRMKVAVLPTASEVVFRKLEIGAMTALSLDAGRQVVGAQLRGINTSVKGNFGVKVLVQYGNKTLWRLASAGTVDMRLKGAEADLVLRFVEAKVHDTQSNKGPPLLLEVKQSNIREGVISNAVFKGFSIGGAVMTRMLPYLKGTFLVRWPIQVVSDYLIRETLEGPVADEILAGLSGEFKKHVDASEYSKLDTVARQEGLKLPFDPLAVKAHEKAPPFRFHGQLIGPTSLVNFRLPNYSPELYRPGGRRAMLQSFNLLTEEVKLDITDSAFERIKFERGSLAFDSGAGSSGSVGEIVVSVDQLEVVLVSAFKVAAETKGLVGWTTGLAKIGEKGNSRTTVSARTLQIKFCLTKKSELEAKAGGSAFTLTESSISPFTSIVPVVTLSNKYLNMGSEVINMIAASLKTQIAQGASLVVQQFMKDLVRKRLQKGLDGLEERLSSVGVELPTTLRNTAIPE